MDVNDSLSDNESSNERYCNLAKSEHQRIQIENKHDMKNIFKGKAILRGSSNSKSKNEEDISIHTGQPKSSTRFPKWPEDHNVILGELLMEQHMNGNIPYSNLKKECWFDLVQTLNRRLGTQYNIPAVMIRFKNMKADFRILYQLSNRSGWGWDENLHIPTAPDELWDEIIQENYKLARFRRNPFHQYEIFEKICAENIVIGTAARTNKLIRKSITVDEEESDKNKDNFMNENGISFVEENEVGYFNIEDVDLVEQPSTDPTYGATVGSKRSSEEVKQSNTQRRKKNVATGELSNLVKESRENTQRVKDCIERHDPYSMSDCLRKLSTIEKITPNAILAVHDALLQNKDTKSTLMNWDGDLLRHWIEYVVSCHPRFCNSVVWLE